MEIQVGKQYFTRCGLITGPIESNENNSFYPLKALVLGKPEFEYVTWDKSGIYTNLPNSENGLDLVEEYVPDDKLRVKEQITNLINDRINQLKASNEAVAKINSELRFHLVSPIELPSNNGFIDELEALKYKIQYL